MFVADRSGPHRYAGTFCARASGITFEPFVDDEAASIVNRDAWQEAGLGMQALVNRALTKVALVSSNSFPGWCHFMISLLPDLPLTIDELSPLKSASWYRMCGCSHFRRYIRKRKVSSLTTGIDAKGFKSPKEGGIVRAKSGRFPMVAREMTDMRLTLTLRWTLFTVVLCVASCAPMQTPRAARQVVQNPCDFRKSGDTCVAKLPIAPPVVAGEGRLWALFATETGFAVRQFSDGAERVIATGGCPSPMNPVLLGKVNEQPAVLCVDFAQAQVAYGAAHGTHTQANATGAFGWQPSERLNIDAGERLREVSHFVWQQGRLSLLYRTGSAHDSEEHSSGANGSTPRIGAGKWWLHVSSVSSTPEPICPRTGVTSCASAPLAFYSAEGQLHVVLSGGKSAGGYLHVTYLPGKSAQLLPVADVPSNGKALTNPCVAASPNGSLRVYMPARTLVSSLLGWQGERMGLIEQRAAVFPQGSEVYAESQMRCPPDVSSLGSFPNGHVDIKQIHTRWVRATRIKDTWVLGYAVAPFELQQGDVTYRYSESFWVLSRRSGR